jgi:hypothetical protein
VNVTNPTQVGIPVETLKKYFVLPNSQEYSEQFIFISEKPGLTRFWFCND